MTFSLVVLTRYGTLGASSRLRFFQYLASMQQQTPGLDVQWQPLLDDQYLTLLYAKQPTRYTALSAYAKRAWFFLRHRAKPAQVHWIEKELWPWAPAWLELWVLGSRRYVIDLDDAIFHNYDLHRSAWVRRVYGRKIDHVMRHAALVVAGNPYLASRAMAAGAKQVRVLPTVIDTARYAPQQTVRDSSPVKIVWIGSMSTARYLQDLAAPLQAVAAQHAIELLVIGANVNIDGVVCRSIPWQEATEAAAIAQADIGIMPLRDSPWEQGKCGYKLIQYMGCGLPVVASAVGANVDIVDDQGNGFLVTDNNGWARALLDLVQNPTLRQRMGAAGRARVDARYSLTVTAPRLHDWLAEVARGETPLP
jgi:glycosyltransferase involved in cell wall biosynthesis